MGTKEKIPSSIFVSVKYQVIKIMILETCFQFTSEGLLNTRIILMNKCGN